MAEFAFSTTGKPAPVHLELLGLQGERVAEVEADMEVIVEEAFTRYPAFRPEPEPHRLAEAARLLAGAERPMIVAGGGTVTSEAGPEIVKLAEALSIPVATSLNAKEIIAANHPLAVGVVGTYSRWCANQAVAEADLVMFVGSHTGDQVTDVWTVPRPGTPTIQIDIDPAELGRSYPATVPMVGDAKATLRRLLEKLAQSPPRSEWPERTRQVGRRAAPSPSLLSEGREPDGGLCAIWISGQS